MVGGNTMNSSENLFVSGVQPTGGLHLGNYLGMIDPQGCEKATNLQLGWDIFRRRPTRYH